ncbi:MAG: hypothetical protein ACNA8S_00685 [Deferrisomatales bacterium]
MGALLLAVALCLCAALPAPGRSGEREIRELLLEMDSAYSRVEDYRLRVHSVIRRAGEAPEETDLTYWFRRPDRFRMELRNPHPGLTLVHPHGEGRVRVRPGGLLRFLKISLDPGSARLEVSPGQRVDQTDLGLLIRNISRSLAGAAPGAAAVRAEGGTVVLSVEGENHFLPGVWTR